MFFLQVRVLLPTTWASHLLHGGDNSFQAFTPFVQVPIVLPPQSPRHNVHMLDLSMHIGKYMGPLNQGAWL